MTELTRRSFLAGAAAVATAPVVGTAHAKDTKLPRREGGLSRRGKNAGLV